MTMGRSYPSAMPSRHDRYLREQTAGVDVNWPFGKNASADFAKKSFRATPSSTIPLWSNAISRWPKRAARFALSL